MKISKQIMNPARIKQLQVIAERNDETTAIYVHNKTNYPLKNVNASIQRFGELGLITFTGGGYFTISGKGKEYLAQISGIPIERNEAVYYYYAVGDRKPEKFDVEKFEKGEYGFVTNDMLEVEEHNQCKYEDDKTYNFNMFEYGICRNPTLEDFRQMNLHFMVEEYAHLEDFLTSCNETEEEVK